MLPENCQHPTRILLSDLTYRNPWTV